MNSVVQIHDWITPSWPAPSQVRALITTRVGGVSDAPYASLNLGDHVGDRPEHVQRNRAIVRECVAAEPAWLKQVHDTDIVDLDDYCTGAVADGCIARRSGQVCVIMTADCLPVLLCDRTGSVVGAAHAGWRGLCNGVIEATVKRMGHAGEELMAYLGPAVGPKHYEVGTEVRDAFVRILPEAASAFTTHGKDKFLADLYALARQRLSRLNIGAVFGGNYCTFAERERFFSFRRDGETGRMASLIWLE